MRTRIFALLLLGLCRAAFAQPMMPCKPPCVVLESRVPQNVGTMPPESYVFNFDGDISQPMPASLLQNGFYFGTGTAHLAFSQIVLTSTYANTLFMQTSPGTAFPNAASWIVPSGETQPRQRLVLTWQPGALKLGQQADVGSTAGFTYGLLRLSPQNMTDPALFFPSTFQIQAYVNPVFAYVTGSIQLQGCTNAQQVITFEFRPADGSKFFTRTVFLTPLTTNPGVGTFTFTDIPMKTYTVHIKGAKWLAANIQLDTTSGSATGVFAALRPGDANNDNTVDTADFGILVNTYGLSSSEAGYDDRADFTCDGAVDIADFGAMVSEYNATGDP